MAQVLHLPKRHERIPHTRQQILSRSATGSAALAGAP
jgi:hypothetical protein